MKTIGITKITVDNPVLASYVKTINSWELEQNFTVIDDHFYGIFLEDMFLGASTMQYNPETSNVDILMLNGSTQNYDRIEKESTEKLMNIALVQYGAKTANVRHLKRVPNQKVKTM